MTSSPPPHSAQFFVPTRQYWWNDDYLALLAARWRVADVRSCLDVGCGVGHWTRALTPHLPDDCRVVGVDPESRWVAEAVAANASDPRLSFRVGRAESLPFADAQFDMVTCQTVLIHVRDPEQALREMFRVLKPNGLFVAVEPNNAMAALSLGSALREEPLDTLLGLIRLHETCVRGKHRLGEGWNSLGEELPGLVAKLNVTDMQVYVRDTAQAIWPPYALPAQQAAVSELQADADRNSWAWGRSDAERYFLAGGGSLSEFDALWNEAVGLQKRQAAAVATGRHSTAGGAVCYVVSARRLGA